MTDTDQQPPMPPVNRVVTQRDIALACGVHQTTVSMVMRGDVRVGGETAERVRAAARALGYDAAAQEPARRMVMRRYGTRLANQTIGLLFPAHELQVRYFTDILSGIADAATGEHYGLLTNFLPAFGTEREITMPASYQREQVDGLISLQPPIAIRKLSAELRAMPGFADRPILSLIYPLDECATIVTDNVSGAYQTLDHLLTLGHRHVLQYVPPHLDSYESRPIWEARLEGLRRAMAAHGLNAEHHLHTEFIPVDWQNPENIMPELHRLAGRGGAHVETHPLLDYLRAHPAVTAILGWNDATAIRAWLVLRAAGIRVPEEISIVGFDDTDPLPGPDGANLLSSVRLPLYELGQLAVHTIIRLAAEGRHDPVHLSLPTEFVPRASIAPPGQTRTDARRCK